LAVVLPNGDVINPGGKLARDAAGYDLTRLQPGSERTLGIITKAILTLIPKPATKQTMLALYHDFDEAAKTGSAIIANRIIPATLEFLDQETVKVVEDFAKIGLPTEAKAVLLIEQDGPPEVVSRDAEKIAALCKENHAFEVQIAETDEQAEELNRQDEKITVLCKKKNAFEVKIAETDEQAEELTEARRAALTALSRLKPTTILEDATVPRSEIPKMVKAINEIADKYQVTIC